YKRTSTGQPALEDRPIWDEYGLKASETGAFEAEKTQFTVAIWRLQDPTGALGAFEWQRPAGATPSQAAKLAVETKKGLLLVHGNCLISFEGYKPAKEELEGLESALLNIDNSSLPVLAGYLPLEGLRANSERYVTGPAGLQKFFPQIPPSVAAFHYGTEAQL